MNSDEKLLVAKKRRLSEKMKFVDLKLKEVRAEKPSNEPQKLSPRQIQFVRDDALPLCRKYFNKDYVAYKTQILDEIKKKFENAKKRKEKTDKIHHIYVKFFEKLEKEQENEKFYVETEVLF